VSRKHPHESQILREILVPFRRKPPTLSSWLTFELRTPSPGPVKCCATRRSPYVCPGSDILTACAIRDQYRLQVCRPLFTNPLVIDHHVRPSMSPLQPQESPSLPMLGQSRKTPSARIGSRDIITGAFFPRPRNIRIHRARADLVFEVPRCDLAACRRERGAHNIKQHCPIHHRQPRRHLVCGKEGGVYRSYNAA